MSELTDVFKRYPFRQ